MSQNKKNSSKSGQSDQPVRVQVPKEGQILGLIEERLGNRRSKCRCADGAIRICRIPGRVRRRMWTREGDIVLIEPWEVQTAVRGDLIKTYSKPQVEWLEKRKYLDWL